MMCATSYCLAKILTLNMYEFIYAYTCTCVFVCVCICVCLCECVRKIRGGYGSKMLMTGKST